jgi:hypothetical protein
MEKKLLVIDDNVIFRDAIVSAGEDNSWIVMASDQLSDIRCWLDRNIPKIVLLDWQLSGHHRQQYIDLLERYELTKCTLLISSTMDDARGRFIKKHNLAGYRLKPLDLEHLEEELKLPKKFPWKNLDEMANQLDVAVNILDESLDPVWSNEQATQKPPTIGQRLIIKWLRAEMEGRRYKAARRLDWDGDKNCFLESRLFCLNNGNYWLARDWRSKEEKPHDHEILNLENVHTLKDWLQVVAKLLAQRYAISRFRMYKIAPLPHIEKADHPDNPLVVPFFQRGGGFEPDEETWGRTGFLANENPYTKKALDSNYKPEPEYVDDNNPNVGCKPIRYGNKGTHRVLFPVRRQDGQVSALFALDRRLDHANTLTGFDREVVDTAKRMASDDAGPINSEQWSLMKGLIEDLGQRLVTKLTADEHDRTIKWHRDITKIIKNTFAEAGRSPEMIYEGLSKVCTALTKGWNKRDISGHVMGTTPWPQSKESDPISTWYIGLMTDEIHWQAVAGCGDAYEACHQHGEFEMKIPHQTAKSMDPWKAMVIQDFQRWIEQRSECSYSKLIENQQIKIKSWLAVPMQVDGKIRALMVAHCSHTHYFTAFRVSLMEKTAERLLSLLAAAERETRARNAFAASVMHEVKSDSHAALMLLDLIQNEVDSRSWSTSLAEIRHHLEGLNALGRDTLDIFQLGQSEHVLYRRESDKDLPIILYNLINSATIGWRTLYEDTKLEIEMSDALAKRKISLKRSLAFKRVLRVLLHNAFRHGRQSVSVQVALKPCEADGQSRLNITVKNLLSDEQIIKHLTEKLNPAIGGLGSSPYIRGRLGLAVAHQLSTEAGGVLGDLQSSKTDSGDTEAAINLAWPITFIDDNLESKS